jgi:hypothetical protein
VVKVPEDDESIELSGAYPALGGRGAFERLHLVIPKFLSPLFVSKVCSFITSNIRSALSALAHYERGDVVVEYPRNPLIW